MKKEFPESRSNSKTSALYSDHLPGVVCAETSWAVRYCPKGQDTTGGSEQPVPSRRGGDAKGEFSTHWNHSALTKYRRG